MPPSHYPKLQEAIHYAVKRHKGQDRDGAHPMPYITHPIDVVVRLRYVGGVIDEDVLCAGALHDTLEECTVGPEDIEERFGEKVRTLVQQLTREEITAEERSTMTKDQIWDERTRRMIEEIKTVMASEARTIKLADRLSNLSEALLTRTGEKRDRYVAQTHLILEAIPKDTNLPLWQSIQNQLFASSTLPPGGGL